MQNLYHVAIIEKSAEPVSFGVADVKTYSKTEKTWLKTAYWSSLVHSSALQISIANNNLHGAS